MRRWSEAEWLARSQAHRQRLSGIVGPHAERQRRGEKHPVHDFLFQYYSFPVARLMQWHPGLGVALEGDAAQEFLRDEIYAGTADGIALDAARFPLHRLAALQWIIALLEKTSEREPRFSCLGLHEWAMVYRADGVRHGQLPLRMQPDELAAFVESQTVCCSHYDAFRFFTPEARPRNVLQPTKASIPELEQRGCLHTNMDLYKWSWKFFPWIGSDLIAECFLLAAEARELDMRASPYDCRTLGFEPVRIETGDGRRAYIAGQRSIAAKAAPLRARLLAAYRDVAAVVGRGP